MHRHHQKVLASLSLSLVLCLSLLTPGYAAITTVLSDEQTLTQEELPAYSYEPSTEIHDNVPYFQASDLTSSSYETFSSLDDEGPMRPTQIWTTRDDADTLSPALARICFRMLREVPSAAPNRPAGIQSSMKASTAIISTTGAI